MTTEEISYARLGSEELKPLPQIPYLEDTIFRYFDSKLLILGKRNLPLQD